MVPPPNTRPVRGWVVWLATLGVSLVIYRMVEPRIEKRFVPPSGQATPGAVSSSIPDWVPIFSGATIDSIESRSTPNEHYIRFSIKTNKPCIQVAKFYDQALNRAGFRTRGTMHEAPDCSAILRSDGPGRMRSINLSGGGGPVGSNFGLEVVQRTSGLEVAGGKVPPWFPVYPGASPDHFASRAMGAETIVWFSFTLRGDPLKVLNWYDEKLKSQGHQVSVAFDPVAGGRLSSQGEGQTQSVVMDTSRPVDETTFHVEARTTH
jgi:hypothetical protein